MSPQIYYFHIDHNTPCLPPRILHNYCFQFLLGITAAPREIQDNGYAKNPSNQKRTANTVRNTITTTLCWMRGKIVYRRYCVFVTAIFFCPEDSCCGEVPGGAGGTTGNPWWGCAPGSPNPDPTSDPKMSFSHPLSELASKIHIRFQTWPLRNCY